MAFGVARLLLLCVCIFETACEFRWKDCASDPQTAAFTFNNFQVWPNPAIIPGDIHISTDLTVNRRVHTLYIDEDVDENLYGDLYALPCLGEGIGTCNNIDCCHYQQLDIPDLWEKFMFFLLGNESVCPVESKSVLIQDEVVHFPSIPQALSSLAKNNFTVRLHFKDGIEKQEHIGCIEFDFEFLIKPTDPISAAVGRRDEDTRVDNT